MTRKNLSETTQTRASSLFQLVGDDARGGAGPAHVQQTFGDR